LVAVVSPSDANDEGLESLVVVAVAVVSPSDAALHRFCIRTIRRILG